jgi:isocitrate lyase
MANNGVSVDFSSEEARWTGVVRPYSDADVKRLQGSVKIEYTLARLGAKKFWKLLQTEEYIPALGALSGNQVRVSGGVQGRAPQPAPGVAFHIPCRDWCPTSDPMVWHGMQAVQMAKAGLKAIYLSGWQVAADSNTAGE